MRKSWHASVSTEEPTPFEAPRLRAASENAATESGLAVERRDEPCGSSVRSVVGSPPHGQLQPRIDCGDYGAPPQHVRAASCGNSCGSGGGYDAASEHEAQAPPHTPPSSATLWAKRRGSNVSPGSLPDNLQLLSLRGSDQWQDLQSPLDVFARKHCPSRTHSSRHSSSSAQAGSGHERPAALWEMDEEEAHSPNNHSPLAALLRREFPAPNKGSSSDPNRPQSERRLFDDL